MDLGRPAGSDGEAGEDAVRLLVAVGQADLAVQLHVVGRADLGQRLGEEVPLAGGLEEDRLALLEGRATMMASCGTYRSASR
jgi:hypothetical protein